MSTEHAMEDVEATHPPADKGKAIAHPEVEEEDDTTSDEEVGDVGHVEDEEEEDEDELACIDTSNIIHTGRRTRGKQIDFTAVDAGDAMDDEEDDDEDFKAPDEDDEMDTK